MPAGARYVPLTGGVVEGSGLITSKRRHSRLGARYVPGTGRVVERSRLVASQVGIAGWVPVTSQEQVVLLKEAVS